MLITILKKAKVIILTLAVIAFLSQMLVMSTPVVQAEKTKYDYSQQSAVDAKQIDNRALMLQAYLAQYNSPLQNHAQDFIDAADQNGVDWKLVPAISGVESTFGKAIPTDSYNGWGYGVYGDHVLRFKSWNDAIFTLNSELKQKYINKGLTDPYAMNRVYAASPTWGVRVDHFMKDIDQFAAGYKAPNGPVLSKSTLEPALNSDSAVLALK